jgi:hypothetical protein
MTRYTGFGCFPRGSEPAGLGRVGRNARALGERAAFDGPWILGEGRLPLG